MTHGKFSRQPDPEPQDLFENDQVSRLLLHNGCEIDVEVGSYKELGSPDKGPQIFVATDVLTKQRVCGPTSNIMLIWFVEQSTE